MLDLEKIHPDVIKILLTFITDNCDKKHQRENCRFAKITCCPDFPCIKILESSNSLGVTIAKFCIDTCTDFTIDPCEGIGLIRYHHANIQGNELKK